MCEELRWCLDGCDRVDSIVVNPHKWLFTPIDCSALWTRHPEELHKAFSAHADYLASSEDALDLRDYGPALGRRFRALKLWTVLRWYGRDGLQALIREHVRLAALFEEWVRADPDWEVSATRHFSTVCFRHRTADNDEIARARDRDGRDLRGDDEAARRERDPPRDRQRAHAGGRRRARLGGAPRMRAVIFDLWDTLVDWPVGEGEELKQRVAAHVGGDPDAFEQALARRATARRRPGRTRTCCARSASPTSTSTGT